MAPALSGDGGQERRNEGRRKAYEQGYSLGLILREAQECEEHQTYPPARGRGAAGLLSFSGHLLGAGGGGRWEDKGCSGKAALENQGHLYKEEGQQGAISSQLEGGLSRGGAPPPGLGTHRMQCPEP